MAHLAENATIGARDALDGKHRAVGVYREVERGLATCVHVLRGYLACVLEALEQGPWCDEAPLSVADGDAVDVSQLACREPGGEVRGDAGVDEPALVAADGIEGERGALVCHGYDVAVGDEAELDQGLKAVADTEHEAVPVLEQLADCLADCRGPEEGRDELGRPVGFVASGEAAGDHDYLAASDLVCERSRARGHGLGREVVDHKGGDLGAGGPKGTGAVVLAVVARKHGYDHARSCQLDLGGRTVTATPAPRVEAQLLDLLARSPIGKDRLHPRLPSLLERRELKRLPVEREDIRRSRGAECHDAAAAFLRARNAGALGELDHKAPVGWLEERVLVKRAVDVQAQLVADTHLEERLGKAAVAGCGYGQCLATSDESLDEGERVDEGRRRWRDAVSLVAGMDEDDVVSCRLELG